ncbi:hypothetical protein niasHT_030750 [Heterodera trifolii]|uniref:RNA helicase n=1 Tax=Heterodera trifolii TaxID=157864 RepID=A0ABD2HN83_9BILA
MTDVDKWVGWLHSKGIQVESHLRLFTAEAVRYMTEAEFHRFRLKYITPQSVGERTRASWPTVEQPISEWLAQCWDSAAAYGEQCRRVSKARLFNFICMHCRDCPDAIVEMFRLVARCKDDDPQAYKELLLVDLKSFDFYARMFDLKGNPMKMDAISKILEPQVLFPVFRKLNTHEYESVVQRAEAFYNLSQTRGAKTEEQQRWEIATNELFCDISACTLLRGLPFCTDTLVAPVGKSSGLVRASAPELGDWYYHFMEACEMDSKTRPLLRYIDPNFESDLVCWRAHKEVEAIRVPNWEQNVAFVNPNEEPTEPRDPLKYSELRKFPGDLYFEPDPYQLRPYQNELVVHANNGKNTIICAPTGSGKTIVATDIIRTHLSRAKQEGWVARCVMLVPTVPLVDQQSCEFVQYLAGSYWVDGFSGCENCTGRAQRVLACDLCVMTPQIFINMLNSVLESERLYLADFTLVVFDECHHCDKGHPYKMIMDQLADLDAKNWTGKAPQIVGLTASLGVGDTSWDMAACRRHMLSLCANLRAETISSVRHQLDNLKDYVTPPVDRVEKVSRPHNNEFVDSIKSCMAEIQRSMQEKLQNIVEKRLVAALGKDDIVFPNVDDQTQYQNRVGLLKKHLQHLPDPVTRLFLLRSINHLSHYFHAIAISDLLPNSFSLDYLKTKMSEYMNPSDNAQFNQINADLMLRYTELERHLKQIQLAELEEQEQKKRTLLAKGKGEYQFNLEKKEILNRLYRILHDQFAKEADARALIFVSTRACAQRLAKHLMEVKHELPMFFKQKNVGYMVSSNQSGTMGGQSSDEQRRMREGFKSGLIKVLVVTSVAEEGVNIAACNLIIRYNNIGSERQMIQRRGRARHKHSLSILLALDTGIEQREFSNMRKEAMMMRCIEDMQEQDEQTLRRSIEEKAIELAELRNDEKMKEESKRAQLMGRRFDLRCACGTVICCSDRVRSVMDTLFVCCDPKVWKRSKHTLTRAPTKEKFFTNCARWECANCGEHWGQIVKFSNVFLPEIRVRAFVLERVDEQRSHFDREVVPKKWKDIEQNNFNVDSITMTDIRSMYQSLLETNPEAHLEYEKQSRQADQRMADKFAEKDWRNKDRKERLFLEE